MSSNFIKILKRPPETEDIYKSFEITRTKENLAYSLLGASTHIRSYSSGLQVVIQTRGLYDPDGSVGEMVSALKEELYDRTVDLLFVKYEKSDFLEDHVTRGFVNANRGYVKQAFDQAKAEMLSKLPPPTKGGDAGIPTLDPDPKKRQQDSGLVATNNAFRARIQRQLENKLESLMQRPRLKVRTGHLDSNVRIAKVSSRTEKGSSAYYDSIRGANAPKDSWNSKGMQGAGMHSLHFTYNLKARPLRSGGVFDYTHFDSNADFDVRKLIARAISELVREALPPGIRAQVISRRLGVASNAIIRRV